MKLIKYSKIKIKWNSFSNSTSIKQPVIAFSALYVILKTSLNKFYVYKPEEQPTGTDTK